MCRFALGRHDLPFISLPKAGTVVGMSDWYDAHNHLHDARLAEIREDAIAHLTAIGIKGAVVNGTSELDWPAVATLAARVPWVIPSFGLHPWRVPHRSALWREALTVALDAQPGAGVGEIGLDRWIKGHNLSEQTECFGWQLTLAAERNLPTSIHCVRAWGALSDTLTHTPRPARGFLIHAYSGPADMLTGFVKLGAYFSFSPYFLHERKSLQRAAFSVMPLDRILVETDAPDLAPPMEMNPHPLPKNLNHPCNLLLCYEALAKLHGMSVESLAAQIAENFQRWTGAQ